MMSCEMSSNQSIIKSTELLLNEYSIGVMPYLIKAKVIHCGADVIVVCGGGSRFHTGAVSVVISTPSLKNPEKLSFTASTIGIPGHKEEQLAREAAMKIARALETTVVVSVGIHVDNATSEEINQLVENFHELIDLVIVNLMT